MGSYLSSYLSRYLRTARASLRPSARGRPLPPPGPALRLRGQERGGEQGHVPGVHPRLCAPTPPPPPTPPGWHRARACRGRMPEARRRFPGPLPGPGPAGRAVPTAPKGMVTLRIPGARHPRRPQSPVTVRIAPPERRGSLYTCPPSRERPDLCARDTVLRALNQCSKGRAKFDGPLWFETPDAKRRRHSPQRGRSAFAPVGRLGAALPLVPRPGPLRPLQPCGPEAPAARPEPPPRAPHPDARAPPAPATPSRPPRPENLKPEVATVSG